jgi:hypothetical protein
MFECENCGHRMWATVVKASDSPPEDLEKVRILVRWKTGTASPAEIAVLRELFEAYRSSGINELMATVGQSPIVEVGSVRRRLAENLREIALAKGLMIEIVD